MFWFNVLFSVLLYVIVFCLAPYISLFYKKPDLTLYIRVLSLTLIISGIKNIQQAYVTKHLMFKKFFFSTLSGTIGAAIVGVFMAYNGYGVWALIVQHLFNTVVDTIILWITVGWKPKIVFSFSRFKSLYSYGWKILLSAAINTLYNELRSLIIGKFYSEENLAYYSKGQQYPQYGVENINSSMNSVLLPILAQKQNDLVAVKDATRKVIRVSSFVIWPLMIGLFSIADKFVILFLSEEWIPAIIFIRILCFSQVLQPLQTTNLNVIKALGRADLHLKIEIAKKTIAIIIVVVYGVEIIAIGSVIYNVIASFINAYPNTKLINYSYLEQLKDIFPFIWMSLIMGGVVYLIGLIQLPLVLVFSLQLIIGILVYCILSKLTKNDALDYCISKIRGLLFSKS